MEHIVKILSIQNITHNVRSYRIEKPAGYQFEPGQATEVSINKAGWEDEKRPFTFTSLNEWPYLEFTIKSYHDHNGVTDALYKLKEGDELIIRDVWGTITYQGPGYFIAGGAGVTPFIAILRQLHKEGTLSDNHLFFSNSTAKDIIHHAEFAKILGDHAHFILTKEDHPSYGKGPINKDFITREIKDFNKPFYVCGPDKMISDITQILTELGAEPASIVFEK